MYDAVLNMSEAQSAAALDQLSGESHASSQSALLTGVGLVRSDLLARMRMADDAPAPGAQGPIWLSMIGGNVTLDGDRNAAELGSQDWGFLIGTDGAPEWLGGDWRLGVAGGYTQTDFAVDDRLANGESDNLFLSLYSDRHWGPLALRLGAAQSWHWIDSERRALGGELTGNTKGRTVQAFGELGYNFTFGAADIEPFANASYVHQHIDGFGEGGGAALTIEDADTDLGFTTLGMRGSTLMSLSDTSLALHGLLGWRRTVGDLTPDSTHAFGGGTSFTIEGTPLARDAAVLGLGLNLSLSDTATLDIGYDGQSTGNTLAHSGRVRFAVSF